MNLLLGQEISERRDDEPLVKEGLRVIYFARTEDNGKVISGAAKQMREYADVIARNGGSSVFHPSLEALDERFDIAHLSNLDWSVETAYQLNLAKRCARRVVISPIHHRRSWVNSLPAAHRGGLGRLAATFTSQDGFERLRNLYLARSNLNLGPEAIRQLFRGVSRRQGEILSACDAWLLGGHGEQHSIDLDVTCSPRPTHVIPNVAEWSDRSPSIEGLPSDFVLSVGRIEARKRQLAVARVLERIGVPGIFVGPPNGRHLDYVREFEEFVRRSCHQRWFPNLPHAEILPLYRAANTHVLASWFEVAPHVDLEAAAAGCRVVTTTHGHTDEYLGDWGVYWSPASGEKGLQRAIEAGLELGPDREQGKQFRQLLSRDLMARALLGAYASVLG